MGDKYRNQRFLCIRPTLAVRWLASPDAALHHHHAAEDDLAWPKLQARVPDRGVDIARMADQHAEIAAAVGRVESLLTEWTKSASPALTEQL